MNKFIILVLSLSLTAASCSLFGGASGTSGVLKSEDGGKTFLASNTLLPKGDLNGLSVSVLTVDENNQDVMYIGSTSGIFKTEDGAKTWVHILAGMNVVDLISDPNQADLIYAVGLAGANGKIIKSPDAGATWADVYTEPSEGNAVASIAISKANSKILLAGLATGEIIRSTDEGTTWQAVTDIGDVFVKVRFYNSTTAYALAYTKGLYKSTDQGSSWTQLKVGQGSNVDRPLPPRSAQNNSTRTASGAQRYLDISFDQKLNGVIFLATQTGLLRTVDDGVNWSVMYLPVRDTSLKVTAVAVSPNDSNNIVIAVGSTLFKTRNGGITWETDKLPTGRTVRQIIINQSMPNVMFLGMGNAR